MKKRHIATLLTTSIAVTMPLSFLFVPKKASQSVKATPDSVYIAIKDGTAYISSELKEFFYRECPYFEQIDITENRFTNIFDRPIADSYIDTITKITILDEISIYNASYFFYNLPNLETIENIGWLKTETTMRFDYMFCECPKLKNVDFSDFDTSNAITFSNMFNSTAFESLDLSNFKTQYVANFNRMFEDCENLTSINLSSFDTSCLTEADYMFDGCKSLTSLDLSNFDFSNCRRAEGFFDHTELDIIHAPKNIPSEPFKLNFFLQQYSEEVPYFYDGKLNPHTFAVSSSDSIIYYSEQVAKSVNSFASVFNNFFSKFLDESQGLTVDELKEGWEYFYDDIDIFKEAYDGSVLKILKTCDSTTPNENVKDCVELYDTLYTTYYGALSSGVGDFLDRCPNAGEKDGYIHIGVNTTTQIGYIATFNTYEILCSDVRWTVDPENLSCTDSIFSTGSFLDYEDIEHVVIQEEIEVKDATSFFKGLSSAISIANIDNLNTSTSTSFNSMFEWCSNLQTLDLTGLDMTNAQSASKMFKGCSSLADINLAIENTSNLSQVDEMFYGCSSLIALDLSYLSFENVNIATDFLFGASFFYLKTPKVMPTSMCNINLYIPISETDFGFYDLSFNSYAVVPKDKPSFLIVSAYAKRLLNGFCSDFAKDCAYYCSSDGSTSDAKLIKLWENQSDDFNSHFKNTTHSYLLEFFKQDNSSCTYTPLREFSARYDYIYGKYQTLLDSHGGDFASRSNLITFSNTSNLVRNSLKVTNKVIYVVIALFATSAVAIFVFNKKKHI